MSKLPFLLFPMLLGMLASGCRTYDDQVREVRQLYTAGQYDAAQQRTAKRVAASGDTGADALIWRLEHAALLRAAGKIPESAIAFEQARSLYSHYLDAAKIRILKGGAAMLSTPANLPYYGTGYDGIMIDTYQVLNALQVGDLDRARVNLTRSYLLQQEIVNANSARIEKEKEAIAQDQRVKSTLERNGTNTVSDLSSLMDVQAEMNAYADYVNPFSVYLDGLYHLTQALDASDVERARKSLERVSVFAPLNKTISNDFAIASSAVTMPQIPPSVYVMFETGMAPSLEQVRVDIPIIITAVSYVGISYPKLRLCNTYVPYLNVQASPHESRPTERVVSMDAVVAKEFNNNFASIMAKAIAAAITKAVAATAANLAADQADAWVGLATRIATAAYQLATNIADTRSWQTLPKEIQVARLPLPQDGKIRLSTPDGVWTQEVPLMSGNIIVVYVKSVTSSHTISVNQFKLK